MEMLNAQFIAGTIFVAFVGACVGGLTWISSTLIEVDKNVAVVAVKVDANSHKIDELHTMIRPMWEEFTGRTYDGNLARLNEQTDIQAPSKEEMEFKAKAFNKL
tara:strand:- start:3877 stop:4188 length:312 start_codon:yes stop_codon:yes gene_type:complete